MSEESQDDLALVLRRISALSRPAQVSADLPVDNIPVLTEVYDGADAFSAVEIEQLLAPYYLEDTDSVEVLQNISEPVEPVEDDEHQPVGIKFLPVDEIDEEAVNSDLSETHFFPEEESSLSPQLLLARQGLAEAVMADMQPLIAQAIKDALMREMQVLVPRLGAEVEQAIAESLRDRVTQALKSD